MTKAEQIYGEGYSSREDFVKQVVAENKPSKLVVNFLVNRIADLKEEIFALRSLNKRFDEALTAQKEKYDKYVGQTVVASQDRLMSAIDDVLKKLD